MSELIKTFLETSDDGRHSWKVCTLCNAVVEEKVFSKVVKEFEEVNLLKLPNGNPDFDLVEPGYYLYNFKDGKPVKPTNKELLQATRKYKVGEEYQWFSYSTGGKHVC